MVAHSPSSHKIKRHHPIKCPVCNTHIESPEHFLSCNDTKYQPLFKKFLWNITKYCNTWECPTNLVQLLLLGLQHWPQPPIIPSKFPKEYQQVIQEQQQIGWKQLCYGHFTITWTERNKRKYQTQQWWAMAHGSHWHIWTYLHQQWTHCNNITNNNSSSTTPNNITMQTEITTLYSNQQNFTPSCKPIFSTPLHTLLTKSHHHLSSWLDHNLPFLPKHRVILSPPLTTHPHFSSSSIPTTNSKNNENSNHLKFPSLRASLQSPTSH